jgi:hypothetical protein
VDDGRISASSREECWEKFQFALTVLQLCGWNIQHKKTSTEAVQLLLHLGFVTDSVQMRYFLPQEKEKLVVELLQQTIEKAREGEQVVALDLAKLLGKLNSMRRSHCRCLAFCHGHVSIYWELELRVKAGIAKFN